MALAQQAYGFSDRPSSRRGRTRAGPRRRRIPLDRYLGTYWSFGGEMEVIR